MAKIKLKKIMDNVEEISPIDKTLLEAQALHYTKPTEALKLYEQLIHDGLNNPEIFNSAGDVANRVKDYEKGRLYAEKAVKLDPLDPYSHDTLASSMRFTGDLDNSEKEYLKAIDLKKDYGIAYRNLSILYCREFKDHKKALETLDEAYKYCTPKYEVWGWKGELYLAWGQPRKARDCFNKALRSSGTNKTKYLVLLSESYNIMGDLDKALDSIKKASSINPYNPSVRHRLGWTYKLMSKKFKTEKGDSSDYEFYKGQAIHNFAAALMNETKRTNQMVIVKDLERLLFKKPKPKNQLIADEETIRAYIR